MFATSEEITVTIKLYGGLDKQARIEGYDPETGIELKIKKETKLKKVLKGLGLNRSGPVVLFINGKKAGPDRKLIDKDIVYCMMPISGG